MKVAVPGKIMLSGEYAVLQGASCLAATVDSWLSLSLEEAQGRTVESNLWAGAIDLDQPLRPAEAQEPLPLSALQASQASRRGFRLRVDSDLVVAHGLGSSSALRLAVRLAFKAFNDLKTHLSEDEQWTAAYEAWQEQLQQQSFASGYDTIVQLKGGLVRWTPAEDWPGKIEKFDAECLQAWIHPFVGGRGAPTAKVGGSMRQWLTRSDLWGRLRDASEDLTDKMSHLLFGGSPSGVFEANARHRSLFQDGPGFPLALYNLLASLPGFDRSWTFKTTGAGGEDAILLIGEKKELSSVRDALSYHGWHPLGFSWQNRGATILEHKDDRL